MSCALCRGVRQLVVNVLELADKALNTLTLGDPNENMSRRIARARAAGDRWAAIACRMLTWLFWIFTRSPDHCALALQPGTLGREIWHWSNNDTEPVLTTKNPQ